MPRHRQRHHSELEQRFRKPVTPRVAHRLPVEQQAALAESLERVRASHQAVHEASATLAEGLEHQLDLRRAARMQIRATIAAAEAALEALAG
jgi:hypothetical protein